MVGTGKEAVQYGEITLKRFLVGERMQDGRERSTGEGNGLLRECFTMGKWCWPFRSRK